MLRSRVRPKSISGKVSLVLSFPSFILCVFLSLAGCSSDSAPSATSTVSGFALAQTPVSGASVQILNTNGSVLVEQRTPGTSDLGFFMVPVHWLPHTFRVAASGGTVSGQGINYRLMAQIEGFDPDSDTLYINLVTTLVCRYMDRNPNVNLLNAANAVKRFLVIPLEVDISAGFFVDEYFDPTTFMTEARAKGGVDIFMEELVDEMVKGSVATHSFAPADLSGPTPVADFAASSMATAARNGAISWGVGFALNIAMSKMFPSLFRGQDGPTRQQIEEMNNRLIAIQQSIDMLHTRVRQSQDAIIEQITKDAYILGGMTIATYETQLMEYYRNVTTLLLKYTANPTDDEKRRLQNSLREKMDWIKTQVAPKLGVIHALVHGSGGAQAGALYRLYADKLKAEKRFLSKKTYSDKVKNFVSYYNELEAIELYLILEYCHSLAGDPKTELAESDIAGRIDTVYQNSLDEAAWFKSANQIPESVYIHHSTNTMIYLPDNHYSAMCYPWYASFPIGNYIDSWREKVALWSTDTSRPSDGLMCAKIQYWHPTYIIWGKIWPLGPVWYDTTFSGGMTAQPMVLMGHLWMLNKTKFLGFTDWRFPTMKQAQDMFKEWSGTPGDYAGSQGLTPMRRDRFIITSDLDSNGLWRKWDDAWRDYYVDHVPDVLSWPDKVVSFYATTDGGIGQRDWYGGPDQNVLQSMPIRNLPPDEKYIW